MEDLILTQGQAFHHNFLLFQHGGSITSTTAGARTRIDVDTAHCLSVGDRVVVAHDMGSACEALPLCATVTNVISDTAYQIGVETSVDTSAGGFAGKAMDLTGIRLTGNVRSRFGPVTANPMVGSLAYGTSDYPGSIIVKGSTDFMTGDRVSVPSVGINSAQVTGVYSLSGSGNPIVLEVSPASIANFVGATISRTPGIVAEFNFAYYNNDPQCGVVTASIAGHDTAKLSVPAAGECAPCEAYHIGCFTIGMVRGYGDRVPDYYPSLNYDEQSVVLKSGKAYLRMTGLV